MEATVKANCPWKVMTACSGKEFLKGQWRPVPVGMEAEAGRHPWLDVRETQAEGGDTTFPFVVNEHDDFVMVTPVGKEQPDTQPIVVVTSSTQETAEVIAKATARSLNVNRNKGRNK